MRTMINVLLYTAVVLIWGSTWIMVRFQLGVVPPEVSVAYRIGTAAIILFGWAAARRLRLRYNPGEHFYIAVQGALIFSTNFFLLYLAAVHLTTGLVSVVFSTASAMTIILRAAISRHRPAPQVILGAVLGVVGVGAIFWPQVVGLGAVPHAGTGLLLSLGGTLCFSMGSLVSARNQAAGLTGSGCMAWSMAYGAALLSLFAWVGGHGFTFDPAWPYVGSLLYLSLIGSVAGFACYFALLRRIAAERAAYATVLFPIVALALSTLFEGYQWTALAFFGVLLTLTGNILVLRPAKKAKRALARAEQ